MLRRYTTDGAVIPNNVRTFERPKGPQESQAKFSLHRGYVKKASYPDDKENQTGRMEYVVNIEGQDYFGVIDVANGGGIYNNHIRIRQGETTELLSLGPLDAGFKNLKNGEMVWCLFIGGDGDIPLIIGSDLHFRRDEAKFLEPSTDLGVFERTEFNGLEFLIDKDGNYTIKQVGLKDNFSGTIKNQTAVGSVFQLDKDGNFNITTAIGTEITVKGGLDDVIDILTKKGTDLKIDGANDAITMAAQFGDSLEISAANGIQGSTPSAGGTSISMKNGNVDIVGGQNITLTATNQEVTITASNGETLVVSPTQGIQLATTVAGGTSISMKNGKLDITGAMEVVAKDSVGATLKIASGKVGLGISGAEVLDLFDKTLMQLDAILTAIEALTVPTAVGPSGPPINLAQFTAAQTQLATVKTTLATIKGGV